MLHSENDVMVIADYLGLQRPRVALSHEADRKHMSNPRFFAYVEDRENVIHVSRAIEALPPDVRLGLLIHEFGHIHGGMDEVVADEWVISTLPESGYHYEDEIVFKSPLYPSLSGPVTANNVQAVSRQFMVTLGYVEED